MASATIDIAYDRIVGDIVSAFDEVRLKGGTVPSSKVSANLAAAIQSISTGVSVFGAIVVDFPAGSTCTCSDGSTTYTAGSTGGNWVFTVPSAGTWTVTATDGTESVSDSVSITTQGQGVSVELNFRLPPAYQGVEYIQGDNNAFINTGAAIFGGDDYSIDIGITLPYLKNYHNPWGNSAEQKRFECFIQSNGTISFRSNFGYGGTDTISTSSGVAKANEFSSLVCSRTGTTHSISGWGKTTTVTKSAGTASTATLLLFSDITSKSDHRMHYCKVVHQGSLVRDMVACYRKADSVPGMWDVVTKTFYTNAATSGGFIVGGDL